MRFLGLLWVLATSVGGASEDAPPLTVDEVVRAALALAEETAAARGAVMAAEGERGAVSTLLANPTLQVGVGALGARVEGSLSQPFSFSGEGWQARRAARAGVDEATAWARRAALVVAARARAAFAAALTTGARWRLADEALAQAERMHDAAERLAAAGELSPLEVHLARVAEAEAAAAAIAARREEAIARVSLAELVPAALTTALAGPPEAVVPVGRAPASRSDVAAVGAAVREAEGALARARAAAVPAVGLGVFYEREGGDVPGTVLGPQVTWDLPVWWRNQAGVGEARADLEVATAAATRVSARAEAEQAATQAAAAYADEVVAHLGDFEAEGRAALSAIEAGWTQGDLALADAVLLRRSVLEGWTSALLARQLAVEARLDALLASEDARLLPEEGR